MRDECEACMEAYDILKVERDKLAAELAESRTHLDAIVRQLLPHKKRGDTYMPQELAKLVGNLQAELAAALSTQAGLVAIVEVKEEHLVKARERIKALEKDAVRLDWLEVGATDGLTLEHKRTVILLHPPLIGDTLRSAIDAARGL